MANNKKIKNNMNKPEYLVIHHTGGTDLNPMQDSSNYTVQQCSNDHRIRFGMKSRTGLWCGYHIMIDKFGNRFVTRYDDEEGAHAKGYNNRSLGICLIGNFDATLPTKQQIDELKRVMKEKADLYHIPPSKIIPHRNVANKTCYGMKLSESWARDLIGISKQAITTAKLGDTGSNIVAIQSNLIKGGYVYSSIQSGVYDEDMAKYVLFFQLQNKVADNKELSNLRGEVIGPKTLKQLNG